ncbi:MAG TPA: MBL fold metallo-hydrolase [Candidatus Thermoplasmatota archaeon]|nr:MBL fold metallo-hydrolase [Candidatus Thermoplasmatota archaeon]
MRGSVTILRLGGRGMDCNQFLVKDPKANRFDMVDAGLGTDFHRVLGEVAAVLDPKRVRRVVLTHEHVDHCGGLPLWREMGAELVASRRAALKLHEGHDPTSEAFGARIPRLDVDTLVGEGDTVQLGERAYAVLETPGHAPGSACYWDEGGGVLFAGDMLFAEGGIGRFDFPDSDPRQILDSILRLGALPVRVLHSGHGPSLAGDAAARSVKASVRHAQVATAQ